MESSGTDGTIFFFLVPFLLSCLLTCRQWPAEARRVDEVTMDDESGGTEGSKQEGGDDRAETEAVMESEFPLSFGKLINSRSYLVGHLLLLPRPLLLVVLLLSDAAGGVRIIWQWFNFRLVLAS